MTGESIRVGVVDDHPLYREGIALAIERAADLVLACETQSVEDFQSRHVDLDVVLLDLHLPGVSGSEAVEQLVSTGHRVLVVSAAATADAVVDAMGAGASGYLTKEADGKDVVAAVRVIAAGGTYVSPTLAGYLLQVGQRPKDRFDLSDREYEILGLVAEGETDKEISAQLYISVATVRSHLDRIRDKTGARRRVQLASLHKTIRDKK